MFPTPTPIPTNPSAPDLLMPTGIPQELAVTAVQWWHTGNSVGITGAVQLMVLILILILGTIVIINALKRLNA